MYRYSPKRRTSFSPIHPGRSNSIVQYVVQPTMKTECKPQMRMMQFYQTQAKSPNREQERPYAVSNHTESMVTVEVQKLKFELKQRDQELNKLRKHLALEQEERTKLRQQLEQRSEDQLNKEREITKLLAVIHQLQDSKRNGESKTVKSLQLQVETLEKYITKLTRTVNKEDEMRMQAPNSSNQETLSLRAQVQRLEDERSNFLNEFEKLTQYLNNLVEQNAELQEQYQDKCLELQKCKLMIDEMGIMEQELRGKTDEVRLLRDQLYHVRVTESVSKENLQVSEVGTNRDQLEKFLERIRTNYLSKDVSEEIFSFDTRTQ